MDLNADSTIKMTQLGQVGLNIELISFLLLSVIEQLSVINKLTSVHVLISRTEFVLLDSRTVCEIRQYTYYQSKQ